MEIFQIKGIVQNLLYIGLEHVTFSDLELETEYQSAKQQHNINTLPKPRNIILENHLSIFILP